MSVDIVLITETWLSQSVYDSELFNNHYNILRKDRDFASVQRSRGGGVLLALRDSISFRIIDTSNISANAPMIDLVICDCVLGGIHIYIVLVYVPPDVASDDLEAAIAALESVLINRLFILVGDFNIPDLFVPPQEQSPKARVFSSFLGVLGAIQYNTVRNDNDRVLDLFISNTDIEFRVIRCDNPVVPEDGHHPSLEVSFSYHTTERQQRFPTGRNLRYNFYRATTLLFIIACLSVTGRFFCLLLMRMMLWMPSMTSFILFLMLMYRRLNLRDLIRLGLREI